MQLLTKNLSKIGKIIRFSKIGITTFTLGKINREISQRYLLKELGQMPGIPAKMGQILMMKMGQNPTAANSPKPIPIEWIKHHIQTESPKLADEIEYMDESSFTASVGQVHRAFLKNGSEIAIKVRYPGIENEINDQLDLMMAAFKKAPTPNAIKIDTDEYAEFLKAFFKEELNYLKEAEAQMLFKQTWAHDQRFTIPQVYLEYSTPSLLVQSFEKSYSLDQNPDFPSAEKNYYYRSLFDFFLDGLFNFGLVHTDLHIKNWGINLHTKKLVVYDFGATLNLSFEMRIAIQKLAYLKTDQTAEYLKLFGQLGFDAQKMLPIQSSLVELCEILFEPIRHEKNWNPQTWNLQKRVNDLLGSKKWNFRTAGPPWFFLFIRGLNGWIHAIKLLYPLQAGHTEAPLPPTQLYIRVTENGSEKVSLQFPSHSVQELEDLMPDHVLQNIKNNNIKLTDIIERALSTNHSPQILFESKSNHRHYKVWLA